MVQTHAYGGWVRASSKPGFAYQVTRSLGGAPAPLFFLLAGIGAAWAARGAAERGTAPAVTRRRLARRGLEVLVWGWVVSAIYAVIEWTAPTASVLRADVLHAIGLSLVVTAFVLVGRERAGLRAGIVFVGAVAVSVVAGRWLEGRHLPAAAAVPLALLVDVPPFTRFPLVPLVAFTGFGFAAGIRLRERPPAPWAAAALAIVSVAATWLFAYATVVAVDLLGGRLSRAHPAVALNLLSGAARALVVLFVAYATTSWLGVLRAPLVRLGRHSLLAYAFHIPFCYGRLASPFTGRLDMPSATGLLAALLALTWLAVRIRDAFARERR
jgi:hypothetical protein